MPTFGLYPVKKDRRDPPRQFATIKPGLRPIAGLYPPASGGQVVDTRGQNVVRVGGMPHTVRPSELGAAIYTGASTSAGQFGISHVDTVEPFRDGMTVVGVMRRAANVQQTFTALSPTSTSPLSSDYYEVGKPSGGTNIRFRSRRSAAALSLTLSAVEVQSTWFTFVGVFESGSIRGYVKCLSSQPGVVSGEITGTAGAQTAMPRASFGGWNFRSDNANLYQPTAGGDIILMQWLNVALNDGEASELCNNPYEYLFGPDEADVMVIDRSVIGTPTNLNSEPELSSVQGGQNYQNADVQSGTSASSLSTIVGWQDYIGAVAGGETQADISGTQGSQGHTGAVDPLTTTAGIQLVTGTQNYVSAAEDLVHAGELSAPVGTASYVGSVAGLLHAPELTSAHGIGTIHGTLDGELVSSSSLSTVEINEVVLNLSPVSANTQVPASRLKDIPVLDPSGKNTKQFADRMREVVQTFQGNRGDKLDRALTVREAMKLGVLNSRGRFTGVPPGGSDDDLNDFIKDIVDNTPEPPMPTPPTPTGLVVTAGISHIYVKHDQPAYYGHFGTIVYAAIWASSDPTAPTFSEAVEVGQFQGNIGAIASDPATRWCVWIKWVNKKGEKSIDPAGGTNGAQVRTGQDVGKLLDALTAAAEDPNSPYTKVSFRADMFYIGPAYNYIQDTDPGLPMDLGKLWKKPSTGEVFTWGGASWEPFTLRLPFIVQTRPTEINGMYIPPGVYMDSAFIYDLTASIARLGDAWIDNAMIANLSADKITAGALQVGSYIESADFSNPINQSLPEEWRTGWRINANGTAQMYEMTLRGAIYARYGQIGGARIGTTFVQSTNWALGVSGWTLDNATGTLAAATCQIAKNIAPGQEASARVFNTEATGSESVLRIGESVDVRADGSAWLQGDIDIGGNVYAHGEVEISGNTRIYGDVNIADKVLIDTDGNAFFEGKLTANSIDAVNTLNIAGSAVTSHEISHLLTEEGTTSGVIEFPIEMAHGGDVTFLAFVTFYGDFYDAGQIAFQQMSVTSAKISCISKPSGSTVGTSAQVTSRGAAVAGGTRSLMMHVTTTTGGVVTAQIVGNMSNVGHNPPFSHRQVRIDAVALRRYR